jgi:polyhydroxyalkanoate synthesis repressor PhaR
MPKPEVLIRKYSDRRLYDTGASRYVTLGDIARMVRDGIEVRVVDGRTGKDITHIIMTQIIVEDAKERKIALPLQLLTQLVRASDKATHDFLSWYLDNAFDLYQKAQSTVTGGLEEAKKVAANPLEFVSDLLGAQLRPPVAGSREVEELRRQVKELQAQLAKANKPARRTSKRRGRR